MTDHDEQWSNLELPGFSHEQLMDPNLNYVLANLARNKDPKWIEKQKEIYGSDKFKDLISNISKENWKDPEFQSKQYISRVLAWALDDERKKRVIEQFSQPKTDEHKKSISESNKLYYQTEEGKRKTKDLADKQRGIPRKKVTCPYCAKEGGDGMMQRWHFNNCKEKKDE